MNRRQAVNDPLCWLPGDRYVYADLNVTPRERRNQVIGSLLVTLVLIAIFVGFLALGGLLIQVIA